MARRPSLAVWKFASCDGCQLALLGLTEDLLPLAGEVEIRHFLEASSRVLPGPYDLSLVEGSVTTPGDVERIQEVRRQSRWLVTIGACATAGGIQALRNTADLGTVTRRVYPRPELLDVLPRSTAIGEHVLVDFELRGCPIDKGQLLELVSAFLVGRRPEISGQSVCNECKRRRTVCVMVADGTPCLGPVTQAGCGALCPAVGRGCYGCFGPMETPNTAALAGWFRHLGLDDAAIRRAFTTFNADAPAFRAEAGRHGGGSP